jgi:triosephosphate isomerase
MFSQFACVDPRDHGGPPTSGFDLPQCPAPRKARQSFAAHVPGCYQGQNRQREMTMRRKLAAGNWKMNGSLESLGMIDSLAESHRGASCDILLCPPAHLLMQAAERAADGPVLIGGQSCHAKNSGAHTGDLSAPMLKEAGATHIIVGHSERRESYGETDADVQAKATAAQSSGLVAIVCLGESLAQRDAGEALDVIRTQLEGSVPATSTAENLVVAYEPIWAIGTGKIPTMEQIAEVHATLRGDLHSLLGKKGDEIRLLYGGSVKPGNAADIFALPDVDGALVGGASLTAEDFSPIISALDAA